MHFIVAILIEHEFFLVTQDYRVLGNSKPFANQENCVIFQEDAGFHIHMYRK